MWQSPVEVVVGGRGDRHVVEVPAAGGRFEAGIRFLVHFGRIVLRAADIPVALTRIYDHCSAAPTRRRLFSSEISFWYTLQLRALLLIVSGMSSRRFSVYQVPSGVGEDAQPFETHLAHERQQFFEIGLRLARITHRQQRRAQCQVGDRRAQAAGSSPWPRPWWRRCIDASFVHRKCWNGMSRYLRRFRLLRPSVRSPRRGTGGVGVVEPDPFDAVDAAQAAQQLGEHPPVRGRCRSRSSCAMTISSWTPCSASLRASSSSSIGTETCAADERMAQ